MPPRRGVRRQGTIDSFLTHNSPNKAKIASTSKRRQRTSVATSQNRTDAGSSSSDSGAPQLARKKKAVSRSKDLSDSPSTSSDQGTPSRPPQQEHMLFESEASSSPSGISPHKRPRNRSSAGSEASGGRAALQSSSESEDRDFAPWKRRRIIKGNIEPLPDGEGLLEELDSDTILDTRLRAPKKSKFSHDLDRLKRAKAKRSLSPSEAALSSPLDDSDEPFDIIPASLPPGARVPTPSDDSGNDRSESEEFIVEDNGENVDVDLPLEFSMKSHSDLAVHFKIICQLYVHLATIKPKKRPNFIKKSLKDDYFSVPLAVLRRKLRGTNDSTVASSIWKPHFRKRLDTHPQGKQVVLAYSVALCDACHISGRVATISFRLKGPPYDRNTFEEIEIEDAFEGEEEANPDGIRFCLGKFCAKRALTYHTLAHWEYGLFMRLEQEVRHLQNPDGSELGNFVRVNWGPGEIPEDVHDPDQIMDWLDCRGVIGDEYLRLTTVMEQAQTLDAAGHD